MPFQYAATFHMKTTRNDRYERVTKSAIGLRSGFGQFICLWIQVLNQLNSFR